MLDCLLKLSKNINDPCYLQVEEYFKNHIYNWKFAPIENYTRNNIIFRVFNELSKHDVNINKYLEQLSLDGINNEEKLYILINGDNEKKSCPYNRKKFNIVLQKYNSCQRNCECAAKLKKENTIQTNLERYGCENTFQYKDFKEKSKQTMLRSYGVEHALQNAVIKNKLQETNLKKYGFTCSYKNEEVKAKARRNNEQKYGVEYSSQINFDDQTKSILFNKDNLLEALLTTSIYSLAKKLNVDASTICDYCIKYDIRIKGKSSYENDLSSFLTTNGINFIERSRKIIPPYELDFYIPEFKVAIEVNGLYWHCEKFYDKNYHKNKWQLCHDVGIQLLTINEDEFVKKRGIINAKILNLCKKTEKGTGARNLIIEKINNSIANEFVKQHHIQGATAYSSYSIGAYFNNELVGVMLFNKQRNTQKIELIRFCSNGKSYPGMFSKMFKFYTNENIQSDEIISFADLRYSNGNLYEKCGFIREKIINPDYKYIRHLNTYHKSNFKKANIIRKFNLESTEKTEKMLASELGYLRTWDCGKIKFVWRRKANSGQ